MNYFIFIFIFCIVLFLYLHIYHHLKISKDLEVYSIVNPTKEELEEICEIRQPVVFTMEKPICTDIDVEYIHKNYGAFDINIINMEKKEDNSLLYYDSVPFVFNEGIEFLKLDSNEKGFISMDNNDFLEETTLIKGFKQNDYFLRPPLVSKCEYDILMGSKNSVSKCVYDINYRNYIMCNDGRATIRVISPTYNKYMDHQNNYLDFEFYTPLNIWNIQSQYKNVFDKVKTMDIILNKGDIVYIPAYWYYSIRFDNKITTLSTFKYRTYMNTMAILPELCIYMLQNQNIKRKKYSNYKDNDNDTDKIEIENK